ncbi:MAG: ABC transporter ATP-binding protein [Planctomycetales bacterium]|nr:ABC transporter ATP-binding protein [Planctomycetales bacterium]
MHAIETEGLRRVFRRRRRGLFGSREDEGPAEVVALEGADLVVSEGETFGLLGPNGAGKTTLIKILATLLTPSTGRARVRGFDVESQPLEVRRRIALVSGGEQAGYGILTVREQLWVYTQFHGLPTREVMPRIDAALERFGLADRARSKLSKLSTGERQKMNVIRGFLLQPEVLILDEPTLGLDVSAARAVRVAVREWVREAPARSVLLTTHYMTEADELCDRVAFIHKGRLLACDTPDALKRRVSDRTTYRLETDAAGGPSGDGLLDGIPGVAATASTDPAAGRTRYVLSLADEGAIGEVVSRLSAGGVRIRSLRSERPTLEDVFLAATGEGLGDGA